MGQGRARVPECSLGLGHSPGWRDPSVWAITCCFSRCALPESWNWTKSQDSNWGIWTWDEGIPRGTWAAIPNAHPCFQCAHQLCFLSSSACRDPLFSPHPVQPLLSAISLIVVNLPRVRRCFHCNSELPFPDERCYWASLLCPFGHLYVFPWKISV